MPKDPLWSLDWVSPVNRHLSIPFLITKTPYSVTRSVPAASERLLLLAYLGLRWLPRVIGFSSFRPATKSHGRKEQSILKCGSRPWLIV